MKAKVLKTFKDKYTKTLHKAGEEIEITKERFEELTSPFGVFVKEIEEVEGFLYGVDLSDDEDMTIINSEVILNFEKMIKAEIVEYAAKKGIELNMKMTKAEMIKILSR